MNKTLTPLRTVLPHPGTILYRVVRITGYRCIVDLLDPSEECIQRKVNSERSREPCLEWRRREVLSLDHVAKRKDGVLEAIVLYIRTLA